MGVFDKKQLFKALLLCDMGLVLLYILSSQVIPVPSWTVRHWFDMNSEMNIPSWFSSIQLFVIAGGCFLYAFALDRSMLRRFYLLAGVGFVFFSADEASKIHEGVARIAGKSELFDAYVSNVQFWMIIYPGIALIIGIWFRREIAAFFNDKIGRLTLVMGSLVYVTGVIGCELVAFYLIPPDRSLLVVAEVSIEEGFELLGQSIMVYGVMMKIDSRQVFIGLGRGEALEEDGSNELASGDVLNPAASSHLG